MQCDSRGNVERYKAKFVTKVLVKEKKEHTGYHNSKFIYGLKKATRRWYLKFKWNSMKFWVFQKIEEDNSF